MQTTHDEQTALQTPTAQAATPSDPLKEAVNRLPLVDELEFEASVPKHQRWSSLAYGARGGSPYLLAGIALQGIGHELLAHESYTDAIAACNGKQQEGEETTGLGISQITDTVEYLFTAQGYWSDLLVLARVLSHESEEKSEIKGILADLSTEARRQLARLRLLTERIRVAAVAWCTERNMAIPPVFHVRKEAPLSLLSARTQELIEAQGRERGVSLFPSLPDEHGMKGG